MKIALTCSALFVFTALLQPHTAVGQVVGGVLSQEEAQRHGLVRSWYVQANVDGRAGSIVDVVLDKGTLFAQTDGGILQALDAESGETLWSVEVGNKRYPSMPPAATEKFVATINGSTLYILDRATGRELWKRQVPDVAGSGPALSKTHVFVPMVNGTIYGLNLEKTKETPWLYKSFGRIMVQPVVTADTLAWTTEKGYMYLANVTNPDHLGVDHRLATTDRIESRPGHWTPYLYGTSLDGYVYAVNEKTGQVDWKYSIAEPLIEPPVVVNGKVYACVETGGMHCIDGKSGSVDWYAPNIVQFISVTPTKVYCSDRLARMLVLDAKTGARLDAIPIPGVARKLRNVQSDRIILNTQHGMIQCLHEAELKEPLAYNPPPLKPAEPEKPKAKKDEKTPAKKPAAKPAEETDESAFGDTAPAEPAEGDASEPKEEAPAEKPAEADDPFGDK